METRPPKAVVAAFEKRCGRTRAARCPGTRPRRGPPGWRPGHRRRWSPRSKNGAAGLALPAAREPGRAEAPRDGGPATHRFSPGRRGSGQGGGRRVREVARRTGAAPLRRQPEAGGEGAAGEPDDAPREGKRRGLRRPAAGRRETRESAGGERGCRPARRLGEATDCRQRRLRRPKTVEGRRSAAARTGRRPGPRKPRGKAGTRGRDTRPDTRPGHEKSPAGGPTGLRGRNRAAAPAARGWRYAPEVTWR